MTAVYASSMHKVGFAGVWGSSLDEAYTYVQNHPEASGMLDSAMRAFEAPFTRVSFSAAVILLGLTLVIFFVSLKARSQP